MKAPGIMRQAAPASLLTSLLLSLAGSNTAWACATCFGASDDKMAAGMNMGILVLLAVVATVLGGILAAGIALARRARSVEDLDQLTPAIPEATVSISSVPDSRA